MVNGHSKSFGVGLLEKQSELFECDFSVSVSVKLLHQGGQFCLEILNVNSTFFVLQEGVQKLSVNRLFC